MENGNSNKRKFKETQRKAKQRASQTPDKIQEKRAADLRNKARARANETPEQGHERRESNLRSQSRHRERNSNSKLKKWCQFHEFQNLWKLGILRPKHFIIF